MPEQNNNNFYKIIIEPIITEKSVNLSDEGKYTFKVDKKATKNEIKKAVEKLFKVQVEKVNIIKTKPKKVRKGRIEGQKGGFKKAIVTLKKGQKIDILS